VPGAERIEVVHAWSLQPTSYDFFGSVQLYERDVEAATAGVVDRVVDIAGPPPAGVELVRRVVRESPGRALIEASADADLVVVGSRGRGGFKGLLLGSTSSEVAAHCQVPVAVIR
jgi:nucleotide-binding universal stress UspA family protein